MKIIEGKLQVSATDLAHFSSCHHATALDLGVARGERAKSAGFSPLVAALQERGLEHEERFVASLRDAGLQVVDLRAERGARGFEATCAAMRARVDVIVQAALQRLPWVGVADVLVRCDTPSKLGAWSYEPIDTKLATETRAGTVLQLSLYAELLSDVQGVLPERLCVVIPAEPPRLFEPQWYRTRDFDAYFRWIRQQMDGAVVQPTPQLEAAHYPEPVEHCDSCQWWESCDTRRRADDHLSLVAGATRLHRRELEGHEVKTLEALAHVPVPLQWKPGRGSRESIERVREQARVQLLGRTSGAPVHELLPIEPGQGLTRLPAPSPGDVFFDVEGDTFAPHGGREYLFGLAYRDAAGQLVYEAHWAGTRAEERVAFEKVVRMLDERRAADPGFHVYHYAPYEPLALKRLMGRYASCEDELDRLLRGERFVDLYRIARQSVRASVERYSIKDLEPFYAFSRETDLRVASQGRRVVEKAIERGDWNEVVPEVKQTVQSYNREDCFSAAGLRDWLEALRAEIEKKGVAVPRPDPQPDDAPQDVSEEVAETRAVVARLLEGVPDAERTDEQQARWLLAQLLDFHRREDKSAWWEYFRLRELDDTELADERSGLGGLRLTKAETNGNGRHEHYTFTEQETDIEEGDSLRRPGDGAVVGTVIALDRAALELEVRRSRDSEAGPLSAVFEHRVIDTGAQRTSLLALGRHVAERGFDGAAPYRAAVDLLLRATPRLRSGTFNGDTSDTLAFARAVAVQRDHGVLPIQGPPGAGKTHTAAHMICELLRAGLRVGVVGPSHKVVANLLHKVVTEGRKTSTDVRCMAKVKVGAVDPKAPYEQKTDNKSVHRALTTGKANLLGGTAWLWARPELRQTVDVLFVDEAGQFSLANALAVAPAAKSVVLVGDPRQLDQPLRGSHPDGAEVSSLDHLIGEHETISADRGLFLPETWRLCPSICAFTSDSFYEGKLRSLPGLEHQRLTGTRGLDGAGLWYAPVQHEGNQASSPEEVAVVVALVDRLLAPGAEWMTADETRKRLAPSDILIVAPYNAQVSRLLDAVGRRGVAVGTVDKFQGREAPVVIYSMATSTPEEAPRGMDFLYSLNRLNVATSRARCACVLVANPTLFEPECRSVHHVRLANAFCRYREMARVVTP